MVTTTTASASSSSSSSEWTILFFHLICPSLGCLLATAMFAAPIADLRRALLVQSLGDLNPRPWAIMTGNCVGWCAYAYYIQDPFILASNIPGLILSLWLNAGAAKLQYQQMTRTRMTSSSSSTPHRPVPLLHIPNDPEDDNDDDINNNAMMDDQYYNGVVHDNPQLSSSSASSASASSMVFTPQEIWWLRVWIMWSITLVWVGWISPYPGYEAATVGWLVNLNLIFFYGVPLQTMSEVVRRGHSNSIHPPSMVMACGNATFWLLYGIALGDPVLMVPNSIGLSLGLAQVGLCLLYPKTNKQVPLGGGRRQSSTTAASSSTTTTYYRDDHDADDDADADADADDDVASISMTKLGLASSSSLS